MSEFSTKFEDHDPSGAFGKLINWYGDYASEVVLERAIPGIDGFKPGQRRILYKMLDGKITSNMKCNSVVGEVIKIHPHGNLSIYGTLARMVDSAEIMNVPFIKGKGAFGKVYSENPPAADRYTECRLDTLSKELYNETDGIEYALAIDNKTMEPMLLPTSFPNILCNATSGIAVGLASNIPAFNFHEVNEMVIEYLKSGKIKSTLTPDFPSGEYYVKNDAELEKLMSTGRASIKLRGRWHIDGKTIVITCLPYYTTVQLVMRQAKAIESKMIYDIRDESDRHGLRLAVECTSKDSVQYVLADLLKNTDLQKTIMSNITVVINNEPKVIGISTLIEEWVKFRAGVLRKQFGEDVKKVEATIAREEARNGLIAKLLENPNSIHEYMEALKQSDGLAKDYIRKVCDKPSEDAIDWFLSLPNRQIFRIQDRIKSLDGLYKERNRLNHDIDYVYDVIAEQLKRVNKSYTFARRTEATTEDYTFEKEEKVVKPDPVAVEVYINDKFIKKTMSAKWLNNTNSSITCMSDDIISFIDNKGRLLRVYLEQLPFMSTSDAGVYLPSYLGTEDDFSVVSYNLIEDKKIGYLFEDGFVAVVDYAEWCNMQKCTKITTRGISDSADKIIHEIDFDKEYFLVYTEKGRVGVYSIENFKQKHRTARTRLAGFKQDDNIIAAVSLNMMDVMNNLTNFNMYVDTLAKLKKGDSLNTEIFE